MPHPLPPRRPRLALGVAALLAFLGLAWVASPLWVSLMLGVVMAFTAQPVHRWFTVKLGDRPRLSAALTAAIGGLLLAGTTAAAMYFLVTEVIAATVMVQKALDPSWLPQHLGPQSSRALHAVIGDPGALVDRMRAQLGRASEYAAQAAAILVQAAAGAAVAGVIVLATMYYVLLDGARISTTLERLLPLDPADTRALLREFRHVGRGAFVASVASAAIQGVLAGVGFFIAGVPHPATWGALVAVVSFIPVAGTALVWLPVGIYQVATHHIASGLFVFAWSALIVMAAIDYLVRPILAGSGGKNHPLLTLVSLLGGISIFGLPGLVVGPVIMSLSVAILRIYERDTRGTAARPNRDEESGMRRASMGG